MIQLAVDGIDDEPRQAVAARLRGAALQTNRVTHAVGVRRDDEFGAKELARDFASYG